MVELLPPELNEIIISFLQMKVRRLLSKTHFQPMSECTIKEISRYATKRGKQYYLDPDGIVLVITRKKIFTMCVGAIMREYYGSDIPPSIIIYQIMINKSLHSFETININGVESGEKPLKEIFQIAESLDLLYYFR